MALDPEPPRSLPTPTAPGNLPQARWLAVILRAVPLALFLWMVRPLLIPVVLGALFALILYPLQKRLTPKLGKVARYAPAIVTTGALILVVIPTVLLAIKAVSSINSFLAKDWSQTVTDVQGWLNGRAATYFERFHISPESVQTSIERLATSVGRAIANWFGGFATALPGHIVGMFLFMLALYYFLRDGRSLSRKLLKLSPFPQHDTEELFASITGTVNGAILGVLVTAGIQGALTMGSLYVFSVPGAFLLGIVATILAVIPMVGTTPVTFGAVIYLFAIGRIGPAVGMLVMAIIIGLSDNIVRPWVQSSRTEMHPLITLLSIFGGLEVFGAAGIFVGPVLAAIAVWVVDTYADLRLQQLARDSTSLPPGALGGSGPSSRA